MHEGATSTAQRTVGATCQAIWDCSQIEKNEEEKEEGHWPKEDQMEVQWDEDEKLEETLERRRMQGSSLQVDVMQKVLELVVHERMPQGEEVRGIKERKKVKVWSIEEMKDKPNSLLEVDTEEMRKMEAGRENGRRSSGRVQCRGQKKRVTEAEDPSLNEGACEEAVSSGYESGVKIVGHESSLCSENTTCSVGNACMKIPQKKR